MLSMTSTPSRSFLHMTFSISYILYKSTIKCGYRRGEKGCKVLMMKAAKLGLVVAGAGLGRGRAGAGQAQDQAGQEQGRSGAGQELRAEQERGGSRSGAGAGAWQEQPMRRP